MKSTASVFYMNVDREGIASSSNCTFFFFVSFVCQCRSCVLLHVLVPRGRSVRSLQIMEAGDSINRKAPKAKWNTNKDEAKWNKNKTPDLRLRRRRGRVASEHNSNHHPPFCFRWQLPSKQKEINTKKLLEIEKEIVREVVRGDKHNLRKSANRNAQISVIHSAHWTDLCFAICWFSQVVFVTSNNFTHNLLFYFQ